MKRIPYLFARILLLLFLALSFQSLYAQEPTYITDSIFSKALNEQRTIKIRLPEEYKQGTDTKYDVVYMIDGEWNFDNFSFIYKFTKDEKFLPPLILVALPNTYTSEGNMRNRDFLPEKMEDNPKAGGADNFLAFLKNEVIPYIDSKFRTNGENSLFGHSYGGLFTFYTLLKEPTLFKNYYCSDPAFQWKNLRILEIASQIFANTPLLEKTLWINGIENTYLQMGIGKMESFLNTSAPNGLRWKIAKYPNETHNSVRLKGIYDGLKFVYDGYAAQSIVFHPMNGSLLEGKPVQIFLVGNYSSAFYTTDGSEPDTSSKRAFPVFQITGPTKFTIKSFGGNKKYTSTARGNFVLSEVWPALPENKNFKNGGLHYSCYEGIWDSIPSFTKLKPIKTGIADNTMIYSKLADTPGNGCVLEGYIKIDTEGYYLFAITSDNCFRVTLNNKEIIYNEKKKGNDNTMSYIAPLQKGYYPIRIEYIQGEKKNPFRFQYIKPGNFFPEIVPISALYHK